MQDENIKESAVRQVERNKFEIFFFANIYRNGRPLQIRIEEARELWIKSKKVDPLARLKQRTANNLLPTLIYLHCVLTNRIWEESSTPEEFGFRVAHAWRLLDGHAGGSL